MVILMTMSFVHPFFVGVTEIAWNSKSGKIGVSIKVFTDDIQEAIYKSEKVKFQSLVQSENNKLALNNYVKKHFALKMLDKNGKFKIVECTTLGWEVEEEATWIYLEHAGSKSTKNAKQIVVSNEMLFENIPSQIHIVHCNRNDNRKSEQLSHSKPMVTFNW
jgi:hypothetical protein